LKHRGTEEARELISKSIREVVGDLAILAIDQFIVTIEDGAAVYLSQ
jgi:hypothetical protein